MTMESFIEMECQKRKISIPKISQSFVPFFLRCQGSYNYKEGIIYVNDYDKNSSIYTNTILHEFTHHIDVRIHPIRWLGLGMLKNKNGHLDRKSHDKKFYNILCELVISFYGDLDKYNWETEPSRNYYFKTHGSVR